jgi:hypothetical protein
MRKAIGPSKKKKKAKKDAVEKEEEVVEPKRKFEFPALFTNKKVKLAASFVLIGITAASISGLIVARVVKNSANNEIAQAQNVDNEENSNEVSEESEEKQAVGGLEIVKINVPEHASVNIKDTPGTDGTIIYVLSSSVEAIKIGEEGEMVRIVFDGKLAPELTTEGLNEVVEAEDSAVLFEGWVHEDFIEGAPSDKDSAEEESAEESVTEISGSAS